LTLSGELDAIRTDYDRNLNQVFLNHKRGFGACLFLATLTLATASGAAGQGTQPAASAGDVTEPDDDTIEAGEADAETPRRRLIRWNEFEGPFFTLRVGAGVLYDYAAFSQDDESSQQFQLAPESKMRDGRVLLKGRLKFRRPVTWSSGLMYDGATDSWLVRETGIMVEIPEAWGHVFVGRTKEGFSLNKVMVGYAGWTMERATISDATIPILADGVKWLGLAPKLRLLWNVGVYGDWLSEDQSFSTTTARSWDVSHGCRRSGADEAPPRHEPALWEAR
jgi:phosphate-selective porin OprO/OprP